MHCKFMNLPNQLVLLASPSPAARDPSAHSPTAIKWRVRWLGWPSRCPRNCFWLTSDLVTTHITAYDNGIRKLEHEKHSLHLPAVRELCIPHAHSIVIRLPSSNQPQVYRGLGA